MKAGPPILELADAISYRSFAKINNLFLPIGTRLHPVLRREHIRDLLAPDSDQVIWLHRNTDGSFTPQSIPQDSFRPVSEWVEYIIPKEQQAIQEWITSTVFDFQSFVCSDSLIKDSKGPPPSTKIQTNKSLKERKGSVGPPEATDKSATEKHPDSAFPIDTETRIVGVDADYERFRQERLAIQEQFLQLDGPLDDARRQELWWKLAQANAQCQDWGEASLCLLASLWNQPTVMDSRWQTWFTMERGGRTLANPQERLEYLILLAEPTAEECREFAALVTTSAIQAHPPEWLLHELPAIIIQAQQIEAKLPIRIAWLLAWSLSRLNGGDALALARARDRVLQLLLENGYQRDRELPYFLRTAGRDDSERLRVIRDQCRELHLTARSWADKSLRGGSAASNDGGATIGYIDMFFAMVLARMGEEYSARQLLVTARDALTNPSLDEKQTLVGKILYEGFSFRVGQTLQSQPAVGALSPEFREALNTLRQSTTGKNNPTDPRTMSYYAVSRMLEQSRILEPQEKLNPYSEMMGKGDLFRQAVSELRGITNPRMLASRILDLYKNSIDGKATADTRLAVLQEALPLSGRVGEEFTLQLLGFVPETMRAVESLVPTPTDLGRKQGALLENSLFLAAHFDRRDVARKVLDDFLRIVLSKSDEGRYELINVVAGQCLRSLRKLDLRAEVQLLLEKLEQAILQGESFAGLKTKLMARPNNLWAKALQSLLYIASGWQMYGQEAKSQPILNEARSELLRGSALKLPPQDYTKLAQAYIAAAGRGGANDALQRVRELLNDMPPQLVKNSYTTANFFSRLHLNIVEEIVLALSSDDFGQDPHSHRWAEEDEYLIRQRIHRTVRESIEKS
jgi:hypothetical protein